MKVPCVMVLAAVWGTAAVAEDAAAPVIRTFERGEECAAYYNSGMPGEVPFAHIQMFQRLNDGMFSQLITVGGGGEIEEMAVVFNCRQDRGVWFSAVPPDHGMTGAHTERFETLLGAVTGDPEIDLSRLRATALRDFGPGQSGTLSSRTFAVNGFDFDLSCGCSLR